MIVNIVVLFALILGAGLFALWLLNSEIRARIEQPKYDFLDRVNAPEKIENKNYAKVDGVTHEV